MKNGGEKELRNIKENNEFIFVNIDIAKNQ